MYVLQSLTTTLLIYMKSSYLSPFHKVLRFSHTIHSGLFLLALCVPLSLRAQESDHSYTFLNVPVSAQTMAIGGLAISYVDGMDGQAFDNPALYGEEASGHLFLSYINYMSGVNGANVLYGLPIGERGSWAIGARAMNYGRLIGYDVHNIAGGSFTATDAALEGLFNYELTDKLRGGIALKVLYGNIERYSSWGIATDVGVSYYDGDKGLSLGAAITNAGVTIKGYGNRKTAPAWDLRLGFSQRFMHAPFRIHATAYGLNPMVLRSSLSTSQKFLDRFIRHLTFGVEYLYDDKFWIGLGYNPRLAQDLKIQNGNFLSGFSIGLGFNTPSFRVAIPASRYHPSALSFMVTFCTNFGNDKYKF